MASSDMTTEDVPKWKLARQGVQLIINNRANEAEVLFKKYPESIQMHAGYSFAVFMDALMTFEDDKLTMAFAILKEAERRCVADTGWLKVVKSKVFGSETALSLAEQLENQIILADSLLCMAVLIFLQQDISGYLKGGWILRKSWKIYHNAYNEIRNLYKELFGKLPDSVTYQEVSTSTMPSQESMAGSPDSSCEWEFPSEEPIPSPTTAPSNGYIQHSSRPPYPPKMSHSYTTHFDSKQQNNHSNGFIQYYNSGSKCNCKCNSNNNYCNGSIDTSCDSVRKSSCHLCSPGRGGNKSATISARNNHTKWNSIKKSTSVNSALSKHSQNNRQSSNGLLSQFSPFGSTLSLSYFTSNFNIFSFENQKAHCIDKDTISRLMGAVSFGFGIFHLGISLLPPSLLKVTAILGFGGNRRIGIDSLMYARQGVDMRAPLATLSLLWYHTIVRPFYALDGSNVQAGVEAASQLIDESKEEYGNSSLFLFFTGRVELLKSNIPAALKSFQLSVDNSVQREIKILSLHEVGWCHLIQLDYALARDTFQTLRTTSRWSKSFYMYLEIICAGACNNLEDCSNFKDIKSLAENISRGSQLEVFLLRRIRGFPDIQNTSLKFWKLFVYELLYLWNTLPSCSAQNIGSIIADCESTAEHAENEPMLGLSKLVQGSCFCILKQFEQGMDSFRTCLEMRKDKPSNGEDAHISAFAQYELANVLVKREETKEEGKKLLSDITQYKDYDFEPRLTVRVHAILKHM